jgi:hypothetical protein
VDSALTTAQSELDTLLAQIKETAAQQSDLQGEVIVWSDEYTAASDRVERLLLRRQAVTGAFEAAGADTTRLHSLLWAKSKLTHRLRSAQAKRDALSAQSPPLEDLFAVQALMKKLQRSRVRALHLISALTLAQQDPALASLADITQGASSVTYGTWAKLFLTTIGAPQCQNNLVSVVAWQAAEYTQARWNPLATTYPMAGAGVFNGASVRNYVSLSQGLQATALTLRTGASSYGYSWILYRLGTCADPSVTAAAINASMWCHGCAGGAYVTGLIPRVEANYDLYARL